MKKLSDGFLAVGARVVGSPLLLSLAHESGLAMHLVLFVSLPV